MPVLAESKLCIVQWNDGHLLIINKPLWTFDLFWGRLCESFKSFYSAFGGRLSLEYLCNIFITGVKYNKENLVKRDRKSDYWTERKILCIAWALVT